MIHYTNKFVYFYNTDHFLHDKLKLARIKCLPIYHLLFQDCLQYNDFFMIFPCVLNNSNVDLATKETIIDTLPVILSKSNDEQTNMLKEALHNVIINHFPIKSTDLKIGTSRYISYMTCLNKVSFFF